MDSRPLANCINCEYKSEPIKKLNSSELEIIEKNCNVVEYNIGELIFKQGILANYVIYIRNGLIKICNQNFNKRELIILLLRSGNFIGLSHFFCENKYNYSAIAISQSEICFIKKNPFLNLMENNGSFSKKILEEVCKTEMLLSKRLYSLVYKNVIGRISDLLIYFSKNIYNSNEFVIPLNRQELANFVGISKKSFIQVLREFNYNGLIKIDRRKLKIIRMDEIEKLSKNG